MAKNTRRNKHEGIFGSPPEPIFNLHPMGLSPELLEEWLQILGQQNTEMMDKSSQTQGYFKCGHSAESVFLMCERFKLSQEAKFLAVELFDKFMVQHLKDLYCHVQGLKSSRKASDWAAIIERVQSQVLLRVVSCCQLASKLTSHYKVITATKAQTALREYGHRYSTESIVQSELRVLKTMNYSVMLSSPLLYVETLLEILGHNCPAAEVKLYHSVCIKVLDLFYMTRAQVYEQLFQLATRYSTPSLKKREKFSSVERDSMLLAVGVIGTAAYIMDQTKTDKVMEYLSQITQIPMENILDFSTILVKQVLLASELCP